MLVLQKHCPPTKPLPMIRKIVFDWAPSELSFWNNFRPCVPYIYYTSDEILSRWIIEVNDYISRKMRNYFIKIQLNSENVSNCFSWEIKIGTFYSLQAFAKLKGKLCANNFQSDTNAQKCIFDEKFSMCLKNKTKKQLRPTLRSLVF